MMIVKIVERVENEYGFDETVGLSIETPNNRCGLYNLNECPEDATLNRDLSDIFNVPAMLQEAYNAGKAGEDLVFENSSEEG